MESFVFLVLGRKKENVKAFSLKPYTSFFAIKSSCGIQSKALDKSINVAPAYFLLSNLFSSFLLILQERDLNHKIFYKLLQI